jgi:hypothetical protein
MDDNDSLPGGRFFTEIVSVFFQAGISGSFPQRRLRFLQPSNPGMIIFLLIRRIIAKMLGPGCNYLSFLVIIVPQLGHFTSKQGTPG